MTEAIMNHGFTEHPISESCSLCRQAYVLLLRELLLDIESLQCSLAAVRYERAGIPKFTAYLGEMHSWVRVEQERVKS